MYTLKVFPQRLYFKQPAGTSRGTYTTRDVWYIHLTSKEFPGRVGIGECAPLPNLSTELTANYHVLLEQICNEVAYRGHIDKNWLQAYPSILFGLETAFKHFKNNSYRLFDTPFSKGKKGIATNGLIWMNSQEQMIQQIDDKIDHGFRCIKIKIGAINFEEELSLLKHIRSKYSAQQIQIRVDANGAFKPEEALKKLKQLAEFDIHSIEQPIAAKQWAAMSKLIAKSPIPIALDEELIGVNELYLKQTVLDALKPAYIILKPSLHGGFSGCDEWIEEAKSRNIGWWATSALESNIGLNAIAQWTASHHNTLPQGLGTGGLFINNMQMPLTMSKSNLWYKE